MDQIKPSFKYTRTTCYHLREKRGKANRNIHRNFKSPLKRTTSSSSLKTRIHFIRQDLDVCVRIVATLVQIYIPTPCTNTPSLQRKAKKKEDKNPRRIPAVQWITGIRNYGARMFSRWPQAFIFSLFCNAHFWPHSAHRISIMRGCCGGSRKGGRLKVARFSAAELCRSEPV